LKVDPFAARSSKANFKKYIVDPLFSDHDDPCRNLRLLLRSLCLRRTKPSDSVLVAKTERVELTLSQAEQSLYQRILEETRRDIDSFVSTEVSIQKYYTRLFTVILRLRIMCDQGTFCEGAGSTILPTPEFSEISPKKFRLGDFFCELCQSEESLDLMRDRDVCWNCSRLLRPTSVNNDALGTQESWQPIAPSLQSSFPSPTSLPGESYTSDEGYSMKLLSVVENLKKNLHTSRRFVMRHHSSGSLID
jgi:hypothetical protein